MTVHCRQEHPEALEDIGGSCSGIYMSKQFGIAVPPKTITAMQIYINEKCEEEQKKGSKVVAEIRLALSVTSPPCVASSTVISNGNRHICQCSCVI